MRTPQRNDPGIEQHMCLERDGNWCDNPCYRFGELELLGSWTDGRTDAQSVQRQSPKQINCYNSKALL
jgi:hypothetical protein